MMPDKLITFINLEISKKEINYTSSYGETYIFGDTTYSLNEAVELVYAYFLSDNKWEFEFMDYGLDLDFEFRSHKSAQQLKIFIRMAIKKGPYYDL